MFLTATAVAMLMLPSPLLANNKAKPKPPRPNQAPSVDMVSPDDGATFFAPADMKLRAKAHDPDGTITGVKFYANGTFIGEATESGAYRVLWEDVGPGHYHVTAVAADNAGASTTSAELNVDVVANQPPVVEMLAPADDSQYLAPVSIQLSAQASDTDGRVKFVDFYLDSMLIRRDHSGKGPGYTAKLRALRAGAYTIRAIATDNRGATSAAATIDITVADANTAAGSNVEVSLGSVALTFASVQTTGVTAVTTISAPDPSAVPSGYSLAGALAFDITTTATYSGPIQACFNVASVASNEATFNNVRILHGEGGSFVDRTILPPDAPSPDFATTTVCARVDTLSPFVVALVDTTPPPPPPTGLVQAANLVVVNAFRLPQGNNPGPGLTEWQRDRATFEYGGTALAFNPANDSLFIVGHDHGQVVAEVAIPARNLTATLDGLSTATYVQAFGDPSDGKMDNVNPGGTIKTGGLLVHEGKLYQSVYDYYDANNSQQLSHFVSNVDLTIPGDAEGPFALQLSAADQSWLGGTLGAGFFGGYFGDVPQAWQSTFGGPVINGQCCLNIIGRTSWGPALFAINPAELGSNAAPAKPLVYYTALHSLEPAGDGLTNQSDKFNATTQITGVVFPENTSSVLFFGSQGLGEFCYGVGTGIESLHNQPVDPVNEPGVLYCYDPVSSSKGNHAFPYEQRVWAYDANQLAQVATQTLNPWQVTPYATWTIPVPFDHDSGAVGGAAYDRQNGRLFVSILFTDDGVTRAYPLIVELKIQ